MLAASSLANLNFYLDATPVASEGKKITMYRVWVAKDSRKALFSVIPNRLHLKQE